MTHLLVNELKVSAKLTEDMVRNVMSARIQTSGIWRAVYDIVILSVATTKSK